MAYKIRNVAVKIKKLNRPRCLKEAKPILAADSLKEAIRLFREWEAK